MSRQQSASNSDSDALEDLAAGRVETKEEGDPEGRQPFHEAEITLHDTTETADMRT